VQSPRGDAHIQPASATDDPAGVGAVDIVLFATKLYDTESAGELCRPLLGSDTVVISLLNGVDSETQLSRILGKEHVAGGVARISAELAEPGVIAHHSSFASIEFGELDGTLSDRLKAFLSAARDAQIDAELRADIDTAIWRKFILLASFSAITALTRLPAGPIRANPQTWKLMQAAVRETAAVARARDVQLGEEDIEKTFGFMQAMPDTMKSSMLMDLERGRRLELEWLSGAVCRLGGEAGVETPVHCMALAVLAPFADGRA